ncbi:MAG: hypothetical protein HON90_12390 [Halobacteriovoraceae bacterium]|jgi:UDP-2,3-diacylglucosamine pyrophosphatase LpxH|nr:hypothetical protein [Halobacteriovoraceae bacterium]
MKFLKKNKKSKKEYLVISDLHLGAGDEYENRINPLEDFHSDEELVDFFNFYSTGEYANKDVELIINGDFFDLLAVPFIPLFDDEYWSETASLQKLKIILAAHEEVIASLINFVGTKNKSLVYIIGNHDSELLFDSLKDHFISLFPIDHRDRITLKNDLNLYQPTKGIFLQHGHEYESLHHFNEKDCIIEASEGEKYFIPPWGSYYVTHVINKYKLERKHINAVRPIKKFLIHAMIFDTFFAMRFMIANAYFYFMIRFLSYYRLKLGWKNIIEDIINELTLFQDYEGLTREFFDKHKDAKALIVGHTHEPMFREYGDDTKFINTGTWTRMVNLDLSHDLNDTPLTYALIKVFSLDYDLDSFSEHVDVKLNKWAPKSNLPYEEYR